MSQEKLNNLNVEELAKKMDQILEQINQERGVFQEYCAPLYNLLKTQKVQNFGIEKQRYILHKSFSFWTQMYFMWVISDTENALIFNGKENDIENTSSLNRLTQFFAIQQWQIISSRIGIENLMDMLFYLNTGEQLQPLNKSKFKAIKKWLPQAQEFSYFAPIILAAYEFDRQFRTPEIHGTSKFPRKLLLLEKPTVKESNKIFELTNILMNTWDVLIDICEGRTPEGVFNGTTESVEDILQQMN